MANGTTTPPATPGATQPTANRLLHETSPYLLQHAHNPVDWYPWGPEAFAHAQAENKPILLSVGYSACHWCHVMAHESFEDPETAKLMNDLFINIKVDREERPDVDALYMDAVQALTGSGGWPMTVFLTPDGAPFTGGTYFPREPRYGMPSFREVLRHVAAFYRNNHNEVEQQAQAFRDFYRQQGELRIAPDAALPQGEATFSPRLISEAAASHLPLFDPTHGGFGRAPKFPHPMNLAFLLRVLARSDWGGEGGLRAEAREQIGAQVRHTLDAMAAGGIYDQVGGGFHRYSTDITWLVPHFEKMLYDNAQLAPVYLHAWQLFGEARYRAIAEDILTYVLREMTDPTGAFYATQDADSEGVEGKFYVWTPDELRAVLGPEDARVVERAWGVTANGNFEGKNILHEPVSLGTVATQLGMSEEAVRGVLAQAREKLYAARAQRVWPGRDDKVVTAWNGLMQRAFAEAARALDAETYRRAAVANADFLWEHLWQNGRLLRTWRLGQAKIDAFLEDYAALANALLSTYEATGETRHFSRARTLVDEMLRRFWEPSLDAFFDTANDHERLIGRPRELSDNATPSGTSLAAEALLRMTAFTGEERYREVAARVLTPLAPALVEQPLMFGHLLGALDDLVGPFYELALIGQAQDPALVALRATVDGRYLPRLALAVANPEDTEAPVEVPLLAGRGLVQGQPAAYVCQGFVCRAPVTTPDALAGELRG